MTREETKKIINGMMVAFPNYHPQDISGTVDLWASIFVDKPYMVVSAALQSYIATDTKGFAPSPGQVMSRIVNDDSLEPMQAWSLVAKAIRRSGYYSVEEFEKLPAAVQRAVGSPSVLEAWSQLPSDEVHTVTQSQFLKAYKAATERQREEAMIPQAVRELLASTPMLEG